MVTRAMPPLVDSSYTVEENTRPAVRKLGNPGPLGLFGFGITTFVLSCYNAGIWGVHARDPVNAITGLAVFYGGIAQGLAGIGEFCLGNTFGATAFISYAAFWLSYATLLIPWFGVDNGYQNSDPNVFTHAVSAFLLGWTIFTVIMLVASLRTTVALVSLFFALSITFLLLTIAEYGKHLKVHRAGGFMGIFTAAIAWYNALAILLASQESPLFRLPVGKIGEQRK